MSTPQITKPAFFDEMKPRCGNIPSIWPRTGWTWQRRFGILFGSSAMFGAFFWLFANVQKAPRGEGSTFTQIPDCMSHLMTNYRLKTWGDYLDSPDVPVFDEFESMWKHGAKKKAGNLAPDGWDVNTFLVNAARQSCELSQPQTGGVAFTQFVSILFFSAKYLKEPMRAMQMQINTQEWLDFVRRFVEWRWNSVGVVRRPVFSHSLLLSLKDGWTDVENMWRAFVHNFNVEAERQAWTQSCVTNLVGAITSNHYYEEEGNPLLDARIGKICGDTAEVDQKKRRHIDEVWGELILPVKQCETAMRNTGAQEVDLKQICFKNNYTVQNTSDILRSNAIAHAVA